MKELSIEQMEQLYGGNVCAVITGGTTGGGFVATVGGAIANGGRFTWRLGLQGFAVGIIGGALAGGVCYVLS